MKGPFKNKQGSTLLEIIVAIAILGLMVAPVCASLVLSFRLNAESEKILQARLLVESTVEQLMAEGLVYEKTEEETEYRLANVFSENVKVNPDSNDYFDIYISITQDDEPDESSWYKVTVWSGECTDVSVTTNIRIASAIIVPAQEGGA